MNPKLHAWLRLSPIALSTAVAIVAAHGSVPTPWSPVASVLANHCTPPPACDGTPPPCNCDCAGCGYTDDDGESCKP